MITTQPRATRPGAEHDAERLATGAGEADVRRLLTGPEAEEIVRVALGAARDLPLEVRVDRVQHRVGLGVSVGYDVRYGDGEGIRDYVVASSALLEGDGLVRLERDRVVLHLWRHPRDPALPGLAAVCDLPTVRRWLPGASELEFCSYRPLRRAVVRVLGGGTTAGEGRRVLAYLKVVPPRAAAGLVRRHDLLAESGVPAPLVLTRPAPGVMVLSPAPGRPLAEAGPDGEALPAFAELSDLLEALPTAALTLPSRPSWADRVEVHARGAAAALGAEPDRALELARRLRRTMGAHGAGPLVPTHGDLHPGNVFVAGGHVAALIDVDALGPGRRVDDLACVLAHLGRAAVTDDGSGRWAIRTMSSWLPDAVARLPRGVAYPALAARTGAVVLSLVGVAAAPAHRWRLLALARAWCASAETARIDPLIHHLTRRSHP